MPLSVYRELVEELQIAQAREEALHAQNRELVKQNQQLRQEIERVIHYAQHLQAVIAVQDTSIASHDVPTPSRLPQSPAAGDDKQQQIIEVESDRSRYASQSNSDGTMNGWVLAIALIIIVVTSCLGAFLIVHSRLGSSSDR
ncbi:hypothetical protein NIES593_06365 [Hydrococcus rivularis NIES-593]|uniref:Uncharacterized protein n=1 Tax=Hydrococcus rivularis NIES-593 TaxID=1921803 RepID=A0A1U7HMV4_9CYAN|nr:hypothetical protein NIES593_06365 [Hydrococcus rivularis NIES-593]